VRPGNAIHRADGRRTARPRGSRPGASPHAVSECGRRSEHRYTLLVQFLTGSKLRGLARALPVRVRGRTPARADEARPATTIASRRRTASEDARTGCPGEG